MFVKSLFDDTVTSTKTSYWVIFQLTNQQKTETIWVIEKHSCFRKKYNVLNVQDLILCFKLSVALGNVYERTTRSLVFSVMLCGSLFVLFSFFFIWPLCCLSFFHLRLLITPLVSLNVSYVSCVGFGLFKLKIRH